MSALFVSGLSSVTSSIYNKPPVVEGARASLMVLAKRFILYRWPFVKMAIYKIATCLPAGRSDSIIGSFRRTHTSEPPCINQRLNFLGFEANKG